MLLTTIAVVAILLWPERWPRHHPVRDRDEQQLSAAIHSELAAGASLRHAIGAACSLRPELGTARILALAGAPIGSVAAALGAGERLGAAITVAAASGGSAGAVFQRLADRAAADADLAREQRVLTTQARMSAGIVAGMPVLWMMLGGVGRIASLFTAEAGAVAVAGIAMEVVGVGLVWRMATA